MLLVFYATTKIMRSIERNILFNYSQKICRTFLINIFNRLGDVPIIQKVM